MVRKKGPSVKESKALMLVADGESDIQAYMHTHNCTEKTARKNASKWFANARAKVSASDWMKVYNLTEERLAREIDRKLKAQAPVIYQGVVTDHVDDNFIQMRATELLAKIFGAGEKARQEAASAAAEENVIKIIID